MTTNTELTGPDSRGFRSLQSVHSSDALAVLISLLVALFSSTVVFVFGQYNGIIFGPVQLVLFFTILLLVTTILFVRNLKVPITWGDLLAGLVFIAPILGVLVLSSTPMTDDLRRMASASIVPNGDIELTGWTVRTLQQMSGLDILVCYWSVIVISLYTLAIVVIGSVRSLGPMDTTSRLAESGAIIYGLNLITVYLLPVLLLRPEQVNYLAFHNYAIYYQARNSNIDPSLLNNLAVVLPLAAILLKGKLGGDILAGILFALGFFLHEVSGSLTIILVTFLILVQSSRGWGLEVRGNLTRTLTMAFLIASISQGLGPQYFQLVSLGIGSTLANFIVGLIPPSAGFTLALVALMLQRNKNARWGYFIAMGAVSMAVFFVGTIAVEGSRLLAPIWILPYGYYMVVIAVCITAAYSKVKKVDRVTFVETLNFSLFPTTILLLTTITALWSHSVPASGDLFSIRVLNLLGRLTSMPAFGASMVLTLVPLLKSDTHQR